MLVVAGCGVVGLGAFSVSVPATPVPNADPDPEAAVVGTGVAISVGSDSFGMIAWVAMLTEGDHVVRRIMLQNRKRCR